MVKRFLFIAVFGLCVCIANAQKQGQELLDSLLKVLPSAKEDTNKVQLLRNISFYYAYVNPDAGLKYGLQALALAENLKWKFGMAKACNSIAINFSAQSNNTKALEYYNKALKIFEESGSKRGIAQISGNIGSTYASMNDYDQALKYEFKALKAEEEIGAEQDMAIELGNIGSIYSYRGNLAEALEYDMKALKIYEKTNDKHGIAMSYDNIGNIYLPLKKHKKAIEFYFKAISLYKELGNDRGLANVHINLGNAYWSLLENAKAKEAYNNALEISRRIGDQFVVANAVGSLGMLCVREKSYNDAFRYFTEAIKLASEIGEKRLAAMNTFNIGAMYLQMAEDTVKKGEGYSISSAKSKYVFHAIEYYNKSLVIFKELSLLEETSQADSVLSVAYKMTGNYKAALEAHEEYVLYKDSVFNKETTEKVTKLELQREFDKKQLADSVANTQLRMLSMLKLQKQKMLTYLGLGATLLLLGFSFFIIRNYKLLGKEKQKSEELLLNILPSEVADELKDRGATTARHFDDVTIMFTDFVNFTGAGVRMGTQQLVDELHTCFKAFDEIISKYNIEKIKTIGDAYLAVAGLPVAQPQHAEHIIQAALEIRDFMKHRRARMGEMTFDIRIGIHSGSVVAGIVGVKKFSYDIWGDTVNTATRMEQSSEPGKINISQTTYELVKDKFNCSYRGEVEAKNKGMLKMYFIN